MRGIALAVMVVLATACFVPVGDPVCEIVRGRIVAGDGRTGQPCTLSVFAQRRERPDERLVSLGSREVKTGAGFSYRTFCPTANVHVTITCEGYVPYTSQTFLREQGTTCPSTIDLRSVTVEATPRATGSS